MRSAAPRIILISLPTLALALLVLAHAPYLNGVPQWRWTWRRIPTIPWYGLMGAAALPVLLAVLIPVRYPRQTWVPILALMLAVFVMKLASVAAIRPPNGMTLISDIVKSPEATSYFTDAAALSNFPGWLGSYPEFLYWTSLHTQSKPPGPLLYWASMVKIFGYNDRAAVVGGILLGILATLSIPAVWWMVKLLTRDGDAGFHAATALAFCPGFVLFFPMFDPIYIIPASGMIGLWHLTVTRDSYLAAVCFGIVLMIATLISYPLLSLGPFLLMLGLLCSGRTVMQATGITLRQGVIAIVIVAVAYGVMWIFTRFDPITTFQTAWQNQRLFLSRHEPGRLYPATIPWDLLDFALGAGWIPVLVALLCMLRAQRAQRTLVFLCLAQPILLALSGLVQSETARVWSFMLPLLLLPVGLELKRWDLPSRATFYACMWVLLAVIGQNMTLINPGLDQ